MQFHSMGTVHVGCTRFSTSRESDDHITGVAGDRWFVLLDAEDGLISPSKRLFCRLQ